MKKTINFTDFVDAFQDAGRDDNFSYDGKKALFEYLEDYEDDTGEEIELDVIALCCEYTEYSDVAEYVDNYGLPYDTCPHCGEGILESWGICPDCEQPIIDDEAVMEDAGNNTMIINTNNDGGFIIADY